MITDLKPYPARKDSGVPWLGAVPEHWEVRRLGQIGRLSKGNGGNKEDEVSLGVPCVRYGDLYMTHTYFILKSRSFVSMAKAEDYTPITFGDVLFAASGETIDEIGKSAVNLMQSEACCGGDVILFRPERQVEARYMGYATDCRPAAAQKATMGRGITVKHIYGDQLKYLTLALPPLPEQDAIVCFLDHAERRIRRYIRAKQKLITLLEEQKQALIHRAVARGLDPNVRLKPSGVEWLGDVPEHWEVVALRYVATKLGSGVTPRGGATMYEVTGIPFLRSQNIHFDGIRLEGIVRIPQDLHDTLAGTHVKPGDVLLNITGASIGRVCSVPDNFEEGNVNQHVCIIRPKKGRVLPGFLAAFLSTPFMQREIRFEQNGASREGLTLHSIRGFKVALPTAAEQQHILDEIRGQTGQLAVATATAQGEVDLLREYRTRLIADVVTGKLDVREAAARLPDEDEEPEPLDETDTLINGKEEPSGGLAAPTGETAV